MRSAERIDGATMGSTDTPCASALIWIASVESATRAP